MLLPEEQVLDKLNAVSTAKRLANMVRFVSFLQINLPHPKPPLLARRRRHVTVFHHHRHSRVLTLYSGGKRLNRNCTILTSDTGKRSTESKRRSVNPISPGEAIFVEPRDRRGFGFFRAWLPSHRFHDAGARARRVSIAR